MSEAARIEAANAIIGYRFVKPTTAADAWLDHQTSGSGGSNRITDPLPHAVVDHLFDDATPGQRATVFPGPNDRFRRRCDAEREIARAPAQPGVFDLCHQSAA